MSTYKVEVEFIAQVEQLKAELSQTFVAVHRVGEEAGATAATMKSLGDAASSSAKDLQKVALAEQRLATEQARTAVATANATAANDRAALVTLRLQQAQEKLAESTKNTGTAGAAAGDSIFSGMIKAQAVIEGVKAAANALWGGLKSLVGEGIKFNSAMETAQLGIASLIAAQSKLTDESGRELKGREALNAALVLSSDQMQKLKIAGLETVATTEQLVVAYQQALGVGLSVGMSLDEIREVTIKITQAASALGVPMNQLAEEVRDLLQGNINPRNTRIATALHITNEEVRAWQAAGGHTLADELNKRMEAFGVAGEKAALTWSGVTSNVIEASQTMAGAMTQPLFDRIKNGLQNALKDAFDLKNARISDVFSGLVEGGQIFSEAIGKLVQDALSGLVSMLEDLSAWLKANEEEVRSFTSDLGALAGFVGGALAEGIRVITYILGVLVTTLGSLSGFLPALMAGLIAGAAVNVIFAISLEGIGAAALSASLAVKAFLASLGPVGWAAIAVGTLAAAFTYMGGEADRAHASTMALLEVEAKQAKSTSDLAKQYLDLARALDQGGLSVDQTRSKKEQLRTVIEKLKIALPEYRDQLDKITGSYKEQREQIEAILRLNNVEPEAKYRAKLDEAAAAVKEAEALGKLIQIDANNEDPNAPYVAPFGARDKFTALFEHAKAAKAEADVLKQKILELPELPEIRSRDTPKPEASDRSGIISAMEIEARLASMRSSYEEKITLEQQKRAALIKAEAEYLQEAAKIKKEAAEGDFDGNQAGVDALWYENIRRREQRKAAIERDFAIQRQALEIDLQAKLTAGEEGGLAQRLEAVRKHYVAVRAEALTLRTAQWTDAQKAAQDEQIAESEQAARERARQDQIKADLGKLKQELAELAQIKGGPLTSGEMTEALDRFAKKSPEAAAAVEKLRVELHLGEGAWSGFADGIGKWLAEASNHFEVFKAAAGQMLGSTQNAFSGFFASIIQHGQTAAQKWDALWKGLANSVVQAATQIMGKMALVWVLEKAISAWRGVDTKVQITQEGIKTTAKTASAVAQKTISAGVTAATVAEDQIQTSSAETTMAARIYAWYSSMGPWAIPAAAVTIAAVIAAISAIGKTITAHAVGGVIDHPTLALMGEAGTEIVAPEHDFKHWANSMVNMGANLQANVSRNDRIAMDYSLQSAGYASGAASSRANYADSGGAATGVTEIHIHQNAPVWDPSQRGLRGMGESVIDATRAAFRERSVVIRGGEVFGGV